MKKFDKSLAVTFASGGLAAVMLCLAISAVSSTASEKTSDSNAITVELDESVMNLFRPTTVYANADSGKSAESDSIDEITSATDTSVADGQTIADGSTPLSDSPYVTVDEYGNTYYHIIAGDTLCKISTLLHYSVDELAEYNHIQNVNMIYAESDLRIPQAE